MALVEFALIAPVALLLVFGIVVLGIVVTNNVQLSNATRDAARSAAICGGPNRGYNYTDVQNGTVTITSGTTTLPNGQLCTFANLQSYVTNRLTAIPAGGVSTTLDVCTDLNDQSTCQDSSLHPEVLDQCSRGRFVKVQMQYAQALYLPLVGRFFVNNNNNNNTRTLTATAEATCEQ